ncbi:alpha/beta fold hydrolase [Streptomyces europaeiscabiei]|uniref:alpha/beta fold hydrolase n=1 Tax=Streptomyces europaeiscabiei TaxID=146819 RepID=UPI0038D4D631
MHATTGSLTAPDGIHLAYRDHAPGQESAARTLLLLHGLAGHLGEWDELLPPLLAQGHRVVTYDARGHGASTGRPADMSRAACVRDTVTVIRELGLDAHGQAPLTLVGQSLGGHTAFLAPAAHPQLIHSLILIEAGPGAPTPPSAPTSPPGWTAGPPPSTPLPGRPTSSVTPVGPATSNADPTAGTPGPTAPPCSPRSRNWPNRRTTPSGPPPPAPPWSYAGRGAPCGRPTPRGCLPCGPRTPGPISPSSRTRATTYTWTSRSGCMRRWLVSSTPFLWAIVEPPGNVTHVTSGTWGKWFATPP